MWCFAMKHKAPSALACLLSEREFTPGIGGLDCWAAGSNRQYLEFTSALRDIV
jgi:hypothetical protein